MNAFPERRQGGWYEGQQKHRGVALSIFLLSIKHKEIRCVVELKQSHSVCKAILQKELKGNQPRSSTIVLGWLHGLYTYLDASTIFVPLTYKIPFLFPPTLHSQLLVGNLVLFYIFGSNMCSTVKPFLISLWKISICMYVHPKNNKFHCHPRFCVFPSISRHKNLFVCRFEYLYVYLLPNKMYST